MRVQSGYEVLTRSALDDGHVDPAGRGQLDVRRLDGITVWRAEGLDGDLSKARFTHSPESLSSSFRMPDETWRRIQQREDRSTFVFKELGKLRLFMQLTRSGYRRTGCLSPFPRLRG
jgi:hypothetical protein